MDEPDVTRTKLNLPEILKIALQLPKTGVIVTSSEMFTYLNIDDAYITQLTPMLQDKFPNVSMPEYFGLTPVGAHISVMYPNENTPLRKEDIGKKFSFTISDLVRAEINSKHYYVLLVNSPDLLELRHKYGLPNQLNLNGATIDLHITIATAF